MTPPASTEQMYLISDDDIHRAIFRLQREGWRPDSAWFNEMFRARSMIEQAPPPCTRNHHNDDGSLIVYLGECKPCYSCDDREPCFQRFLKWRNEKHARNKRAAALIAQERERWRDNHQEELIWMTPEEEEKRIRKQAREDVLNEIVGILEKDYFCWDCYEPDAVKEEAACTALSQSMREIESLRHGQKQERDNPEERVTEEKRAQEARDNQMREEGAKAERERVLDDVAQYIQKHTHCCSHMPLWVVTKEPLLEFMQSLRHGQKQERDIICNKIYPRPEKQECEPE